MDLTRLSGIPDPDVRNTLIAGIRLSPKTHGYAAEREFQKHSVQQMWSVNNSGF